MGLGNSPVMMASVFQLKRDATKFQIAGFTLKLFNKLALHLIHIQFLQRDESDEDGCRMLVMKDNYNKKIAPFDFDYESQKVLPVNVNISMAVMDVLSISETDLVYVLKFRFLMVWYDYRFEFQMSKNKCLCKILSRLKYHNLKKRRSLNSLSRDEIDKVERPLFMKI